MQRSSLHVLQGIIRGQLALIVLDPSVSWRTRGDVFVHRRHFLVPADAHPRSLCNDGLELHPEHPRRAGWRSTLASFVRGLLFRDDDFEDEIVVHRETGRRIDIANGVGIGFDGGHEFEGDLAARSIEVRLPPVFEIFAAN